MGKIDKSAKTRYNNAVIRKDSILYYERMAEHGWEKECNIHDREPENKEGPAGHRA